MNHSKSQHLFIEAQKYIPGGVNSPVRSFRAVGGTPPFIARGQGSHVWDIDGNEYIDFLGSWGPLILGHANTNVVNALKKASEDGTSFGAPVELEVELARMICQAMPSIEKVRLVNSGTEACMSALRLSRAFTGRSKIIKFAGCYHGHADGLLVRAGSGAMTHGIPTSAGVPESYAQETLVADYNDINSVAAHFANQPEGIAAIIVAPVAGNMGVVPPAEGFLEALREIATDNGSLLIFDEVITGFRVAPGGAQERFSIKPDITCLGKVIGGGLPVGAYGGKSEIMEMVAPLGPMYQAGTLSGNPLAVTAGVATLKELQKADTYQELERKSDRLATGLTQAFKGAKIPSTINRVGSMLTGFFSDGPINSLDTVEKSNSELYGRYFHALLEEGVYIAPSQFEAGFVSVSHTDEDIDRTIDKVTNVLNKIS